MLYFLRLLGILASFGMFCKGGSRDVKVFFPEIKGNLSAITWAHAVNSLGELRAALNGSVMMLEADVVIGSFQNDIDVPIMAHPPSNVSDLSLQLFLTEVKQHNMAEGSKKKGIKLDFKTINAIEKSVPLLNQKYQEMNYPFWFNADILPGPVNSIDEPVDADSFIKTTGAFSDATLSLGWRTRYDNETTDAQYTQKNVEDMVEVLKKNGISDGNIHVTFPVRAGIAANSVNQLIMLLSSTDNSTLTLWGSEPDPVNISLLRTLIANASVERVFVDLPEKIMKQLRLNDLPSSGITGTIAAISFVTSFLMTRVF